MDIIKAAGSAYNVLNPFDPDLGEHTHVCILYRNSFALKENSLISFATFHPDMPIRGWGFLVGIFDVGGSSIGIGSVHLHPGVHTRIRLEEIKIIEERLLEYRGNEIIFGGDFNAGFKSEIRKGESILLPDFIRATKHLGTTLDSRYTEKSSWGIARIANVLANIGIGLTFRTDHVYIDKDTMERSKVACRILPARVSDHLAVEVCIKSAA